MWYILANEGWRIGKLTAEESIATILVAIIGTAVLIGLAMRDSRRQ